MTGEGTRATLELVRELRGACVIASRKLRGRNIMGEEIEARALSRLHRAIEAANAWIDAHGQEES